MNLKHLVFATLSILGIPILSFSTPTVYYTYPESQNSPIEQIRITNTVQGTTDTTGTIARVDLTANGRPYASQKFLLQNTGSVDAEFYLGGTIYTTATDAPTLVGTGVYTIPITVTSGSGNYFSNNDVIEAYNPSTNASIAVVKVIDSKTLPGVITVSTVSGTITNIANGSKLGYPNAYTFTSGAGVFVKAGTNSEKIVPAQQFGSFLIHRNGNSGTATWRLIQVK